MYYIKSKKTHVSGWHSWLTPILILNTNWYFPEWHIKQQGWGTLQSTFQKKENSKMQHSLSNELRVIISNLKSDICSSFKENTHFLWNLNVHLGIQMSISLELIRSQLNPLHTLALYFLTIHLHLVLPSGLFRTGFWTEVLCTF